MAKISPHANAEIVTTVPIADIVREPEVFQAREGVDPKTVEQYARGMKAGEQFPPVVIYSVEDRYLLVDGFHRVAAAELAAQTEGRAFPEIKAQIVWGSRSEAQQVAALANTKHGKQLSRAERRKAFDMLVASGAMEGKSFREAADLMGNIVSFTTIRNWAREDYPGLFATKPDEDGERVPKGERLVDPLSATKAAQLVTLTALRKVREDVRKGSLKDPEALDEAAALLRECLEEVEGRGGNYDRWQCAGEDAGGDF